MESGNKHIRGTGRERVYNFIVEFIFRHKIQFDYSKMLGDML